MSARDRPQCKADAICARMREVSASPALLGLIDDAKLDMLLIALGIAEVTPSAGNDGDWMSGREHCGARQMITAPILRYMQFHPGMFAMRVIVPVLGLVWFLAAVLP